MHSPESLLSSCRDMFSDTERSIQELIHCSILPKFYQTTEFRTAAGMVHARMMRDVVSLWLGGLIMVY